MDVIVLSCTYYMETYMFFCKRVHETTITCMFPCITPVSAHFWPPTGKGSIVSIEPFRLCYIVIALIYRVPVGPDQSETVFLLSGDDLVIHMYKEVCLPEVWKMSLILYINQVLGNLSIICGSQVNVIYEWQYVYYLTVGVDPKS